MKSIVVQIEVIKFGDFIYKNRHESICKSVLEGRRTETGSAFFHVDSDILTVVIVCQQLSYANIQY